MVSLVLVEEDILQQVTQVLYPHQLEAMVEQGLQIQ